MCNNLELIISDVQRLPASSYTHVNHGILSRSWLEHCAASETVDDAICDIFINDEYYGSDHFPLAINMQTSCLPTVVPTNYICDTQIKWDLDDDRKSNIFL